MTNEIEDLKCGIKGIKLLRDKVGVSGLILKTDDERVDQIIIGIDKALDGLEKEMKEVVKNGR